MKKLMMIIAIYSMLAFSGCQWANWRTPDPEPVPPPVEEPVPDPPAEEEDPIPDPEPNPEPDPIPTPTIGDYLFYEDVEGSDPFSEAHALEVGDWGYALQYVSDISYAGNKSARFEIREDQDLVHSGKRAEVTIVKGKEGDVGKDAWYSYAVYFPTDGYEYDDQREIINQWYESGSPSLTIRTDEGRILLEAGDELDTREKYDIAEIVKDTWHTVVVHVIHSHDSDGLVELWYDGVKVHTVHGGNAYNNIVPKWKIGLYKSAFKTEGKSDVQKRVIYFDNVKVGDGAVVTYSDMIP